MQKCREPETVLHLPDVTLVMIDTIEHALARMAIADCCRHAQFGDVLICTDRPEEFDDYGARIVEVPNWPTKLDWSEFSWFGMPPHLRTSHALTIQWDSWIFCPDMWRDEFLDYDIIGAPWPWYPKYRIGNLGFGLRSARLMRHVIEHRDIFWCSTSSDDELYCRKYRPALEEAGFVWAPDHVASDFAFESSRPASNSRHFGFHALCNFPAVLDAERLKERMALVLASPYLRGSYMLRTLYAHHPELRQA